MRISLVCAPAFAIAFIAVIAFPVHAGQYTPADLTTYQSAEFDNGFRAILNSRGTAKNVTVRLVVDIGTNDFPCEDRELPHFAEHLMFSGTSEYTESELDDAVDALGGSWNAHTHYRQTTYELDIYSEHVYFGLALLHLIFTDTQLDDETLETARGVIHSENGGEPSTVREFMFRNALMDGNVDAAYRAFVPESRHYCDLIPTADDITRADVEQLLRKYYVPENMLIIVVGDFDEAGMRQYLAALFGTLDSADVGPKHRDPRPLKSTPLTYETTLSPLLDSTTYVSIDFLIPLRDRRERAALAIVTDYLEGRLWDELRIQRGIAYDPTADIDDFDDFSTLILSVSVDAGRADEAMDVMVNIIKEVRADGIPADVIDEIKTGSLYSFASGYERNVDIAGYYFSFFDHYLKSGSMPDLVAIYEATTEEDVARVTAKYLDPAQGLYYYAAPTVTYRGLAWWGVALVLLGAWFPIRRMRRSRAR